MAHMRVYRNTSLSFGLVNIPVCMYGTTKSSDVAFKVCDDTGTPLKRGYYRSDGNSIEIIDDDETKRLYNGTVLSRETVDVIKQEAKMEDGMDLRHLNISSFIPLNTVPFNRVTGSYYIGVSSKGGTGAARAYKTIVKAMEHEGVAAVCKWVGTTRQTLLVIYPQSGLLMGVTLSFAADVIAPDGDLTDPVEKVEVNEAEFAVASQLINALYDHDGEIIEEAEDTAIPRLRALADAAKQGSLVTPTIPDQSEVVPDLMAALRASLEEAKAKK